MHESEIGLYLMWAAVVATGCVAAYQERKRMEMEDVSPNSAIVHVLLCSFAAVYTTGAVTYAPTWVANYGAGHLIEYAILVSLGGCFGTLGVMMTIMYIASHVGDTVEEECRR